MPKCQDVKYHHQVPRVKTIQWIFSREKILLSFQTAECTDLNQGTGTLLASGRMQYALCSFSLGLLLLIFSSSQSVIPTYALWVSSKLPLSEAYQPNAVTFQLYVCTYVFFSGSQIHKTSVWYLWVEVTKCTCLWKGNVLSHHTISTLYSHFCLDKLKTITIP